MNIFQFWANDNNNQINKIFENLKKIILQNIRNENKDITITITETKKAPSIKSQRYIWGVIIPSVKKALIDFGNEIPNNKTGDQIVYEYLKKEGGFFEINVLNLPDGTNSSFYEFESFGQNKDADKKRQTDFIDFCLKWGAEQGIYMQTPDEWKLLRGLK